MRHPHAEIIHAWAEGAEIEWYDREHEGWVVVPNPSWYAHHQYRVKPSEPKWYENIPPHGVLCWVKLAGESCNTRKRPAVVIEYSPPLFYCTNGCQWRYATPLTDDEIKQFLRGEE